jgi:hypothetical protein
MQQLLLALLVQQLLAVTRAYGFYWSVHLLMAVWLWRVNSLVCYCLQ